MRLPVVIALVLAAAVLAAGCGPGALGTRAVEERYLGMGYANRMYNYGHELYARGRFREAHAAYLEAENAAYTQALREAARIRRMYLEKVIAALAAGRQPPPPPVEDMRRTLEAKGELNKPPAQEEKPVLPPVDVTPQGEASPPGLVPQAEGTDSSSSASTASPPLQLVLPPVKETPLSEPGK